MITAEGWRVPDSFRDAFTVLQEHDVVDAHLAARLRALSGLRNRQVHLYEDVDDRLVNAALEEGLADLDAYARAVAALLDTPEQ